MALFCTCRTHSVRYFSSFNLPSSIPPKVPKRIPPAIYMMVDLIPNNPRNITTATSFTRGEVIRNDKVTPKGNPPFKKPINNGTDEQEQNGVMAPKNAANKY